MDEKAFAQGFICAIATVLRQHDQHVAAEDALKGAVQIDRKDIDPFDLEMLDKYDLTHLVTREPKKT